MPGGHHPRRPVEHRAEVVPVPQFGLAGRQPHPHRQLQRPLRGHRSVDGALRRGERGAHTITGVLEMIRRAPQSRRATPRRARPAPPASPSASASHRRVEPSTSVNRNVTTPEGAAAVMASPRPRRYAPRSQGMSPSRGSDPDSRGRRRRRRGLGPAAPASAAARFRSGQNPRRLGGRQPVDRSLRFLHVVPDPLRQQCLHQNTGRHRDETPAVSRRADRHGARTFGSRRRTSPASPVIPATHIRHRRGSTNSRSYMGVA